MDKKSKYIECLEASELFANDLKNEIYETYRRFDDSVSDYEFLLKNQEKFLDEYSENIKKDIIEHKNTMLIRVDHASKSLINKLEIFIKECKRNLPNIKEINELNKKHLDNIKSELADRRNDHESFKYLDEGKIMKIADRVLKDLEKNILNSQTKMERYITHVLMEKRLFFEPNIFDLDKDLFGQLHIKEKEAEKMSDLGESIKVFCNATGKESDNHGYFYSILLIFNFH
jgi:hypothetical protein